MLDLRGQAEQQVLTGPAALPAASGSVGVRHHHPSQHRLPQVHAATLLGTPHSCCHADGNDLVLQMAVQSQRGLEVHHRCAVMALRGQRLLSCCVGQGPQIDGMALEAYWAALCSACHVICLHIHASQLGPCWGWNVSAKIACDDLCQNIMGAIYVAMHVCMQHSHRCLSTMGGRMWQNTGGS